MFSTFKLLALAALAVGHASAKEESVHIKIHVRGASHTKGTGACPSGQVDVSVQGWTGVHCVDSATACAGDRAWGACPAGAHCAVVSGSGSSAVYGCTPGAAPSSGEESSEWTCSTPGDSPMSVEGWDGVFCVSGQACVADKSWGACPEGAECVNLNRTGQTVYGCRAKSQAKKAAHRKSSHKKPHGRTSPNCNGPNESWMSVEGATRNYCITGQACVAGTWGACPTKAQNADLPKDAQCHWLSRPGTPNGGVFGCTVRY